MASIRLPRFKRVPQIAPIQLTRRDRDIIRQVHRHRFLRSSHIIQIIGGSEQQILRRLQSLYHHGYLDRPRSQIDYFHRGGSHQMVYGIGNKGATLLRDEAGIDLPELDWSQKNRGIGRLFLEHALLISDVMVSLEIACRLSGRIRLLVDEDLPLPEEARGRNELFQWNVKLNGQTRLGLIPDHVFALEFLDQPAERNRTFYFLEADRGTMPITRRSLRQTSFHRKLVAYEATWKQKLHQSRFGFPRFRVLTVTTSAARAKNLANVASRLEGGHGLFLFTHAEALRAHPDPLSLLWETPHAGETESLLGPLEPRRPGDRAKNVSD